MNMNPDVNCDERLQASPTKETTYNGFRDDDFVVNGELTVTITLSEYRRLVAANATRESALQEAYTKRRELETQLATANRNLEELRALIKGAAKEEEQK